MAPTGHVAPGFEEVRDAFAATLSPDPGEGAAFCAYLDGRPVADLAAGDAGGRPWALDTRALVFSGTKALVALAVLREVENGTLRLNDPLAAHWPEFAGGGRDSVLVGQVLAHTAGIPGIRRPVTRENLLDGRAMERMLESEEPWWQPGTTLSYHALTYGWLLAGVVRRASGRALAEIVSEDISRPLGLRLSLGAEREGVAPLSGVLAPVQRAGEGHRLVYDNPPVLSGPVGWWNGEALAAGIPAVGAVGSARDFARLFACLVAGGELDGARILSPATVRLARAERARGADPLTGFELVSAAGIALQTSEREYGPPADAFGHDGVGGSVHGGWPTQHVAFSYVTGLMRAGREESKAILDSLWACVTRAGGQDTQ